MSSDDGPESVHELRRRYREALWGNEAFAIGMLQAVSGAAVFGIFSLGDDLRGVAEFCAAIVITFLVIALMLAVLAAYFRHRYVMWNLKSLGEEPAEAKKRIGWANDNLDRMRRCITLSTVVIVVAFAGLVGALWLGYAGA